MARTIFDEAIAQFGKKPLAGPIVPRDYGLAELVLQVAAKWLRTIADDELNPDMSLLTEGLEDR